MRNSRPTTLPHVDYGSARSKISHHSQMSSVVWSDRPRCFRVFVCTLQVENGSAGTPLDAA